MVSLNIPLGTSEFLLEMILLTSAKPNQNETNSNTQKNSKHLRTLPRCYILKQSQSPMLSASKEECFAKSQISDVSMNFTV